MINNDQGSNICYFAVCEYMFTELSVLITVIYTMFRRLVVAKFKNIQQTSPAVLFLLAVSSKKGGNSTNHVITDKQNKPNSAHLAHRNDNILGRLCAGE